MYMNSRDYPVVVDVKVTPPIPKKPIKTVFVADGIGVKMYVVNESMYISLSMQS